MCTYVDEKATEAYRNKIKGKTGYAWKVIEIDSSGKFYSPFINSKIHKKRNVIKRLKRAYLSSGQRFFTFEGQRFFTGGVFHLCTTRAGARKMKRWLDPYSCLESIKIARVSFSPASLVCVGSSVPSDKEAFGLAAGPDSICVHAYNIERLVR